MHIEIDKGKWSMVNGQWSMVNVLDTQFHSAGKRMNMLARNLPIHINVHRSRKNQLKNCDRIMPYDFQWHRPCYL